MTTLITAAKETRSCIDINKKFRKRNFAMVLFPAPRNRDKNFFVSSRKLY